MGVKWEDVMVGGERCYLEMEFLLDDILLLGWNGYWCLRAYSIGV